MYQRPYSVSEIKKRFNAEKAKWLLNDPVHFWRSKTGIELIHKEPTIDEQERIWQNWQEMTAEQKSVSDKKSLEFFGLANWGHHQIIMEEWERLGD